MRPPRYIAPECALQLAHAIPALEDSFGEGAASSPCLGPDSGSDGCAPDAQAAGLQVAPAPPPSPPTRPA